MNTTNHTAGVIRAGRADRGTQEPNGGACSELAMSEMITNCSTRDGALPGQLGNRLSVKEIARRLDIGRLAVYAMLEQGLLPGIRIGRRWIVTRLAYEEWERTCGMRPGTGLGAQTEVTVLN